MRETASARDAGDRAQQARRPCHRLVGNRRRTESAGALLAGFPPVPWGTSRDSLQFATRCGPRLPQIRIRDRDVDSRTSGAHPTPQPQPRPETGQTVSPATEKLTAYFGPGNCRGGVFEMRRPAPVQLHLLLRGQDKLRIALGVGETIPQRHRKCGPFGGGKLEQYRNRRGWHGSIFSLLVRDGKVLQRGLRPLLDELNGELAA